MHLVRNNRKEEVDSFRPHRTDKDLPANPEFSDHLCPQKHSNCKDKESKNSCANPHK